MATTVTDFLTALEIRLNKAGGITASSNPTLTQVYQVIYEISEWLARMCAQYESDIGRKVASVSLTDGTALYRDAIDDMIAPAAKGYLEDSTTGARDELSLVAPDRITEYSALAAAETKPDKFYIGPNGELNFLQTPDASYTAKIPYWRHQTKPAAKSYTISGASKVSTGCVITATAHGFLTGDRTYIASVVGMTELNTNWYTVTRASANTFVLDGVDSSVYTAYTSGGIAHVIIPFNGIFDSIFIEKASVRFQDIQEYQQAFEASWLKFLMEEAKKIILMRKNYDATVQK